MSQPTRHRSHDWSSIKDHLSGLDGKECDGDLFRWRPSSKTNVPDFLVLGEVAVSFHGGTEERFRVCFRRRAPEAGDRWPGPSPVPRVTWFLEPSIKDDAFAWVVREYSEVDDAARPVNLFERRGGGSRKGSFSAQDLATQVERRLVQHHKEYGDRPGPEKL